MPPRSSNTLLAGLGRRRRPGIAALVVPLALLLVTAAGGAPGDTYTVSSEPAIVKRATPFTYTIRLTNSVDSSEGAQRARIGIPAGVTVSSMTATTSPAGNCVASTWGSTGIVGVVEIKKPGGGQNELCPGGTLTVSIVASAPTEGLYTWTTELLRDTAFALQGSQPVLRVDGTPPVASIDVSPVTVSSDRSASFTFSADEPGAFACKLDNGAFAACVSPKAYGPLADGQHTFQLQVTDVAGNLGSIVTYTWTVDATPPQTTIVSGPDNPTNKRDAAITFTSDESNSVFECQLDGGAYAPCASPKSYANLQDGSHTFSVRAVDRAGNVDPTPATRTWVIDTVAPSVTLSLPIDGSATNDTTPAFAGTAGTAPGDLLRVAVRIYAGLVVTETPFRTFAVDRVGGSWSGASGLLPEGLYTARAEQLDAAGNTGYSGTTTFTVDTGGPGAAVTEKPANPSVTGTATFSFASNDPAATFRCRLDAGDFVPCQSPITYQGLAPGEHIFAVNATDRAGNTGGNATYSWRIVVPPPPPPPPAPPPPAPAVPPAAPDVVPPHDVANVRVKAANASVTLTWALPADPDFDRVSVTRLASGKGARALMIYQGTKRSLTDSRLKNGVRYRYRITTRDMVGNRSAGVEVVATPLAPLIAPLNGANVVAPPLLRWQPTRRATYYNVQVWLIQTFGQAKVARPVKVLSAWPSAARLKLSSRWQFAGNAYRLVPGRYRWYVFPGFGKRSAARYGAVLGQSSFTVNATTVKKSTRTKR